MTTAGLRQLRQSILDHNWVAAAVDLAIVVLGVFLGIEAANWNDSRKGRLEEHQYYRQLIDDLRTDQQMFLLADRISRRNDEAAETSLHALANGAPPGMSSGGVAVQFQRAGFLYLPQPARRTYDELISTGNLRLLRDERAKAGLARYYALFESGRQWNDLMRDQQERYWQASAGVLPREVLQAGIRGREPQLSVLQLADILSKARAKPAIHDLLVSMAAHQERVRRDSEELAQHGRALMNELEPLASER